MANVSWLGALNNNGGVWAGSISNKLPPENLDKFKVSLAQSFGPVADSAPMRCIDGRIGDTHPQLGPQIAGGGPGFSLPFHIAVGTKGVSVVDDFKELFDCHHQTKDRFVIGGHIDDHARPPLSGCGAIDKMPQILEVMVNPSNFDAIRAYSQAIMGSIFELAILEGCLKMAKSVDAKKYFKEQGHSYRHDLLNEIKKRSTKKTIEELEGPHKEAFVVINMVDNSTLDKKAFVAATNNEAQAFNFDYWYIAYLSRELFPRNRLNQTSFIAASLVYNLAAAMVLTDGTQEVGLRQ